MSSARCTISKKTDLQNLKNVSRTLDELSEDDRTAIYRSLAWLLQGMRLDEPAARFLFSILAIESLASYIEVTASAGSPLVVLRATNVTDADRENCIKDTLAQWLARRTQKSYRESLFRLRYYYYPEAQASLEKVFASDVESYELSLQTESERQNALTIFGIMLPMET